MSGFSPLVDPEAERACQKYDAPRKTLKL